MARGIRNFAQLAAMNTKFAEQLDEALKAQGRILRDDWIGQGKETARLTANQDQRVT